MLPSSPTALKSELLAARSRHIGANVALNYSRNPLVILKGREQHLYDESGEEYLDCVNNVCHVGHSHPSVVAAASAQLAALNTNSRYLHPEILKYSARLAATMPAGSGLSVVYWVNSGSEATDLALRLVHAHTRRRGIITVGGGYHGHTTSVISISPYKYLRAGGGGRRAHVREAAIPDARSGRYRGDPRDAAVGAAYAADVARLAGELAAAGAREAARRAALRTLAQCGLLGASGGGGGGGAPEAPGGEGAERAAALAALLASLDEYALDDDGLSAACGAFICESVLSCGGQVVPPEGYLSGAYAAVRAAGGVCIADEVQVGFGRVGSHFWGFEVSGVAPDIVTMGKPMGNGFPLAAVVTTPAIAASFAAHKLEYFNTFGGNPVAGAVANAVMDVIESEQLQSHAALVGAELLSGFHDLYKDFPFLGSVRGVGLMVGLEVLHPLSEAQRADVHCALRTPWPAAAADIVYALRARNILLSTDGMESNVIKLKPPMTFSQDDARRVCAELRIACAALMAGCIERGVIVGETAGDDAATRLVDAAAAFYAAHPELVPVPLPAAATSTHAANNS